MHSFSIPAFDMSSLTALHLLITGQEQVNSLQQMAILYKRKNYPGWAQLKWEEGSKWLEFFPDPLRSTDLVTVCREACSVFVLSNQTLTQLAGIGRDSLLSNLSDDELQVFRNAGLIEEIPTAEAILWWDEFRSLKRKSVDEIKVRQGRKAESWTMSEECKIVGQISSEIKPIWVSLNGDYFGYDISSYRRISNIAQPVLIEVKSFSNRSNPFIYITRTEWNKATATIPAYLFYVWCMDNESFKIFSTDDIGRHIPDDRGLGKWEIVKINLEQYWPTII